MPKCSFATSGHCKIICYSLLSSSRLWSLACLIFFFLILTSCNHCVVLVSYLIPLHISIIIAFCAKKWLENLHNPKRISSVPCWNERPLQGSMEIWLEEHIGHVDVKVDTAWPCRAQGAACTSSEAPVEGAETWRPILHCWSGLKASLAFKGLHIFVQLWQSVLWPDNWQTY